LPDDIIYFFTDGYHDQFGGPNEKKFSTKRLRKKLHEIHALPMAEQKAELEKTMVSWKGNFEQLDDILVMGIRF
jgi:serine phosphatase RsbU (regulator of sigma subunit)